MRAIETKISLDDAADVLIHCRRLSNAEDLEMNSLALDYMRRLPGYVAVPMRWTRDDGWMPLAHGLSYLAWRADYDPEHERYPWVLVDALDGGKDAIVFAPELTGSYPPPTFSQYIQWRGMPAQKAFRMSRMAAAGSAGASGR